MALPTDIDRAASPSGKSFGIQSGRDPRSLKILAKTIYRELRGGDLSEEDVMAIASELLRLVAVDMKDRRALGGAEGPASSPPGKAEPTR